MRITTTGTADGKGIFSVYHGPHREIIPRVAICGYDGVEVHIEDSACISKDQLWELLEACGMRLTSIGTGAIYGRRCCNLVNSDSSVCQVTIQHLYQRMIMAQPDHGLIIVGLITGRMQGCTCREEFFWNLGESLYQLGQLAESYDVQLGFGPTDRYEREHLIRIADGVEYLRNHDYKRILLHLGAVHMNIEGADIRQSVLGAKGYVGHVHVADNGRWYSGHGHYLFLETLQALKDTGYEDTLALKTNCLPSEEISTRKSLENLRAIPG